MKSTLACTLAFWLCSASLLHAIESEMFELDDFTMSPLSSFLTREQWQSVIRGDILESRKHTARFEGEVLTIDTRHRESCFAIADELKGSVPERDLDGLCDTDLDYPLVSVIRFQGHDTVEYRTPIRFSSDSDRSRQLARDTGNIGLMGLGMMGLILALPEDVSNWRRDEMKLDLLAGKWKENVRNGPVWDKDDWAINYIGHPYTGAAYYVVARHAGYSKWESFGYSALMSTFFWEYGMEAFAEKPSIQDLLVTPIIGALIGEKFYEWDHKIRENDGLLLGSKALGSTTLFLMNPAGEISKGINRLVDRQNFIKEANTYFIVRSSSPNRHGPQDDGGYVGVTFEFKF
jgi:hypothetical protein